MAKIHEGQISIKKAREFADDYVSKTGKSVVVMRTVEVVDKDVLAPNQIKHNIVEKLIERESDEYHGE